MVRSRSAAGGSTGLVHAVQTIVAAARNDKYVFQQIFRDAGAGQLVEVDKESKGGSGGTKKGTGTGWDAPFDHLSDERGHWSHTNYQSQRANDNLVYRRLPCGNTVATASNRKGVDIMTDFVEEGWKALGCPTESSCIDLPPVPEARKAFAAAVEADGGCHAALLNGGTLEALATPTVDEEQLDKYIMPLVNDNGAHNAMRAKGWLLRGVAMERLGRSPAHEYDMVRRLWPQFCIPYSSFKCNTHFFPWRLLSDPGARTEAGRTAEKQAVLRMLIAAEYQTLHLGMMGNITEADAKAFPERHFVVVRGMMRGYGLAMHQYSWLQLISSNSIPFGDPQVKTRYGHANDAPSNLMRGMLNDEIEVLIGRPVKPTYSYFGGYRGGSTLSPHTDRLACEFTMSMMLYSDPPEPWDFLIDDRPLHVAPAERGGAHPRPDLSHQLNITLYNGDAGVIRGRRVVHFRDEYKGNLLLQQFHHYVFDDFSEDFFGK